MRKIYDRSSTDNLDDLNVNTAKKGIFMNTTLQAAVHLGQDYMDNLRFTKNQLLKSVKQLFPVTKKLIEDQKEISNLTTIDYKELTWSATKLLCDKVFAITNAKTCVFAHSVLCLGSMRDEPIEEWKNKIKWYLENRFLKSLNRIDGESMEFEWKIFTGFTTLDILEQIQEFMELRQCDPKQLEGRIIFMSMFNDILWREQGNTSV